MAFRPILIADRDGTPDKGSESRPLATLDIYKNKGEEDTQMDTVQLKKSAEVEMAKSKLAQEKAQLQLEFAKKLEEIEGKEKALAGGNLPAPAPQPAPAKRRGRPAKPAGAADATKADGATDATKTDEPEKKDKRLKNAVSWKSMILTILNENKDGLKVDDILDRVNAKGFKTDGNIRQMIYQTLYRLWKTDKVVDRTDEDVYQAKPETAAA